MRKVAKPIAIIIAVLCIAVFVISFFGISSRYGDVVDRQIYGAADTSRGLGIALDATSVIKAEGEIEPELLAKSVASMQDRLALLSLPDYSVATDEQTGTVVLRMAYDESSTFSPAQVANFLSQTGAFTVRIGAEQDEDGKMTGVTAEDSSILLTNDDVKRVFNTYTGSNGEYYYCISLELLSSSATDYANKVQSLIDQGYYSELSWWIDNNLIYVENLDNVTNSSVITVYNPTWTSLSASIYALYMQSEPLPAPFRFVSTNVAQAPDFGSGTIRALGVALAVVLAAAAVLLILSYGLIGVSACVCLLGSLGVLFVFYSGFVRASNMINLTVFSIAVIASVIFLTVLKTIRKGDIVKDRFREGASVSGALNEVYALRFKGKLQVIVPMLVGAVFVYLCFASKANFLTKLASLISGSAVLKSVSGFGLAALTAVVCTVVFNEILSGLMVRSLTSFGRLSDKKWFGGREDA